MPRAKVPAGRRSKRSCSSASIWRAPNLSCRATSSTVRPSARRAAANVSPTPSPAPARVVSSVIVTALQQLVFARSGVAASQLVGVARLGDALAELALDPQREPQRLRRRLDQLVEAQYQLARLVEAALP